MIVNLPTFEQLVWIECDRSSELTRDVSSIAQVGAETEHLVRDLSRQCYFIYLDVPIQDEERHITRYLQLSSNY